MTVARMAVSTDFSEESRRTFAAAAALARRFGAELYVLHLAQIPPILISPWPEVGPALLPEEVFEDIDKKLDELVGAEAAFQGLKVRPKVVRGETAAALQSFLESEGIGLLVMASQGLSGMKRLLLGSFTEKMLRTASCPILVLKEAAPGKKGAEVFARMLVAHDFTSASRRALLQARDWASAFSARARLLFVIEHDASLYGYAATMEGSFKDYVERVRAEALERFRTLLRADWEGIPAEANVIVGKAVDGLLKEAADFGADLIVLGTHSRSGLERFFLGSVAQKIVRRAPCAVLCVRGD